MVGEHSFLKSFSGWAEPAGANGLWMEAAERKSQKSSASQEHVRQTEENMFLRLREKKNPSELFFDFSDLENISPFAPCANNETAGTSPTEKVDWMSRKRCVSAQRRRRKKKIKKGNARKAGSRRHLGLATDSAQTIRLSQV